MSLKIATKLVILLTALSATVIAIFWLKQGHMDSFWTSLGVSRSGARINWCTERVQSLYIYGSQEKLVEESGKWLWRSGSTRVELDYLRVEKWFAKYCQAEIDLPQVEDNVDNEGTSPLLEVIFVDGSRRTLFFRPPTGFEIGNQQFDSETLRKGIKELLAFGEKVE